MTRGTHSGWSPPRVGPKTSITSRVFPHEVAVQGVAIENASKHEPLVVLRYFGPDTNPDAPEVGEYKK